MVGDMAMVRCHNLRDLHVLVEHLPAQEYRDFGYYHLGADIAQLSSPCYSDGTSSTQSSLPTGAQQHSSIILMDLIFLLITGLATMMILSLIAIQCENDYIMQVFMNVFCEIYSYAFILIF